MTSTEKIRTASIVSGILCGSLAGLGIAVTAKEHDVTPGVSALAGAIFGMIGALVPAAIFGKIWGDESAASVSGRLGVYIPAPKIVTYDNRVLRRYS